MSLIQVVLAFVCECIASYRGFVIYFVFITRLLPNGLMVVFFVISFVKSRTLETNPARKGLNYYMIAYSLLAGLNIVYATMDYYSKYMSSAYTYMF